MLYFQMYNNEVGGLKKSEKRNKNISNVANNWSNSYNTIIINNGK